MSKRSTTPSNVSFTSQGANASTGASTLKGAKDKAIVVKSNSNAVQVDADGALWDTVANKFVLPEDTNIKDAA